MTHSESPAGIVVERIRYLDLLPKAAAELREFTQPRRVHAIREAASLNDLPAYAPWPEPVVELTIVFVAPDGDGAWNAREADWLKPPDHADAPRAVELSKEGMTVLWRPGRAVVRAERPAWDDARAALVEFAWYEGLLRSLEADLAARGEVAREDVPRAHCVQYAEREHWPRYSQLIEHFTKLRFDFAEIENRLATPSGALSPTARQLMRKLGERAETEARLEGASDQLENYEYLYEDANDRVSDYRWYRWGTLLEVLIVLLLLSEVVIVGADLIIQLIDRGRE